MPKLFGIDIAGIINQNLGPGLLPVILNQATSTQRVTGALTAGTAPATQSYSGRGFIEDYNDYQLSNTSVETGDRKISILGASLPGNVVPNTGDQITIENKTYKIVRVQRDPAGAVYVCQSRG